VQSGKYVNLILKIIIRGKELRRIAAVVAALMLPIQVLALGVGEIEWKSALNQPLDAEIGLFAVGTTSQHDINVKLASYDAYERAGIEFPSILQDLKFSVEQRKTGDFFIKLTSANAIKDPFLDILVEVDWPSGHLLREFTVLLDLPVMTDQVAGPVSSPVATALQQPAPGSVAAMTSADMKDEDVRAAEAMSTDTMAGGGEAAGATSAAGPIYGESASPVSNNLRYGMVQRGDTLWGIAESMRTDKSISVQQIMMALLKSNPEAFYDNNINNLKAGYVLRLDDPSQLTKMSKSEAAREAQRQYQSWLAKKKGKTLKTAAPADKAAPVTTVGAGAETGEGGPSLKLVSPDEADVAISSKATGGDGQKRSFTGKELESLRQELTYALEASDAGREENTQLRARIAELEEQIGEMQRLLSLRDDALSVLQVQPKDQATAEATTMPGAETETGVVPETAAPMAPAAGPETATTPESTAIPVTAKETAAVTATAPEGVTPAEGQPGSQPVVQPEEQQAAVTPKPVKKPVKPAKPAPEKGILDVVMGYVNKAVAASGSLLNPVVLGGIVGGALLLGGGFWFLRRRKISGDDLEQSMLIEVADKQLSEDMANGTVSDLSESNEETSAVDLLDTASGDNIDATDIDEIDVLAEADVYLAYQRFDRAEELLRDAVEHEPQRHDLMLKLMEVFVASDNSEGFIEIAERCKASGGQEDAAVWDKVKDMGSKIAASHPLFSGDAPSAEVDDEDTESDLPGGDLGIDFGGLDDDLMAGSDAGESAEKSESINNLSSELDDLDFGADEPAGTAEEAQPEAEPDAGLDFDSGPDLTAVAEPEVETAGSASDGDNSLNFDIDEVSPAADEQAASGADMDTDATDNSLEFEGGLVEESDDNALEFAGDGLDAVDEDDNVVLAEDDGGDTTSSEDMSDDIDWLTSVTDDAADSEEDGSSFFSSEDEVATKLDLIRAYIDMGDNDSARNILGEVVEEGSDEQKQEAQDLLRQIG